MRIVSLFLCLLLAAPSVFAQKVPVKGFLRALTRKTEAVSVANLRYARGVKLPALSAAYSPAGRAAELRRLMREQQPVPPSRKPDLAPAAPQALRGPALAWNGAEAASALKETERHIRSSLVVVRGRATGEALGSGFVVRSSSGKLYAVASYHIVGRVGNMFSLELYRADGTPVRYDTVLVSAVGAFGLNAPDAAVLELPSSAAEYVRPLKVAKEMPQPGDELVVWGSPYTETADARVDELKVIQAEGLKIVMESKDVSDDFNGFCGSPLLNAKGEVAGIYSGHAPADEFVFGVSARRTLDWLIGGYEGGMSPYYGYQFRGRTAVRLQGGESVGDVRLFDSSGRLLQKVYLPRYAGPFDPAHTERLFTDVRRGDVLEFDILVHRTVSRTERFEVL